MAKKESQTPQIGDFWERHIRRWKKSGSSQALYCKQNDLRLSAFGYWHRKFNSLDAEIKFVKLPESRPRTESILEIHMGAGIIIRVDAQFDPELLIHILKALRKAL